MFFSFKKKEEIKIIGGCITCGKCCRNLILISKGKPVKSLSQFEKLVKKKPFYNHFNMVSKDKEHGYIYFSCDKLGSDNFCSDYENRPDICRNFPSKNMPKYKGKLLPECGYKIIPSKSF